jgi:hypothetical protein
MIHSAEKLSFPDWFEGIQKMLYLWCSAIVGPEDGDHIKSSGLFEAAISLQPFQSHQGDLLLFAMIDGFKRLAGFGICAGLDFDEHRRSTVFRNDVNFAQGSSMLPGEYSISPRFQEFYGRSFPAITQ